MVLCFYAFVDLEKAYDRVPGEVTRWATRKHGLEEWSVPAVMYEKGWTMARTWKGTARGLK